MRQLLVVCSVILLLGTFSGCRTDPQDILLGTEESVTEEVSGEIPVLKSESENVKQEESEENASSEIKDSEYPDPFSFRIFPIAKPSPPLFPDPHTIHTCVSGHFCSSI